MKKKMKSTRVECGKIPYFSFFQCDTILFFSSELKAKAAGDCERARNRAQQVQGMIHLCSASSTPDGDLIAEFYIMRISFTRY